ncbi:Stk1 family PASTA domain-containing Ser/Thr kinase [Corynebacterium sputi]|uniref:Stk1 family PASTA domain-containing Ser/Thr kinase n=1 Tax=Corynebacterium sputi TaxID=489915 RepID=UPI000425A009|nr:Stk1 family PASTA domain-containing Ser/Thr kinase [Corynebacterium sputi]
MTELREGDILDGRYRIGPRIARGGMSAVYRAEDTRLGRTVAAKVMDPRFHDDEAFRVRFEREARAVARMTDESLVNVYDQGTDPQGHVFLIMELVDGGTLRELLRERGPMPPHAATAVLRPVLRALSLAHSRQMVHRDIKPENVLISDVGGRVKLADFGLVRAAADASVTSNSVIVGTVGYLSPEQVTGGAVTPASDVYSVGVLLFELLTGSTPFSGDTSLSIALQRLEKDVPAPGSVIDGVPPEFDDLVAIACARAPEDRFPSAAEFLEELDNVAKELSLPPFQVPAPVQSAAHRAAESATAVTNEGDWSLQTPDPVNETQVEGLFPVEPYRGETTLEPMPDRARWDDADEEVVVEEPERREAKKDVPGRNRTRTGFALWLVIAILATMGIGLGSWWLGSGRYGDVPSITGMSQAQAYQALTDAGFEPEVGETYSDDHPVRTAAGSEPVAGERAVRGNPVTILMSLGQPTVPAAPPDRSAERYSQLLSERTLTEEVGDAEFSETVPAGAVVNTDPPAGTTVSTGSLVTVILSKGPAPVEVPRVVGLSESDGTDLLKRVGLQVREVTREFDADAAEDEIIAVSPEEGEDMERDGEVVLTVNNGIAVPNVSGRSQSEAESRLREAGITIREVRVDPESTRSAGTVERTNISRDSTVDPDNPEVILYVSARVNVPNVLGSSISDAREALEDVGLELEITGNASEGDTVITQSPFPGRAAQEGDTVTVRGI